MLRLHGPDLNCKVDREHSSLTAFITDYETGKLYWGLGIKCHHPEGYVESGGPSLSIDCMEFPVQDWRQLEGKEGFFCLDDIDDPHQYGGADLYLIGSHDDVDQNRIRFVKRQGTLFTVEWDAVHEEGWKIVTDKRLRTSTVTTLAVA